MAVPGIVQRSVGAENLPTEAKFWPGGIPPFIKSPTENAQVTVKPGSGWEYTTTVKGWYRFVRENWVHVELSSKEDPDESKFQQRRSLIEKWVSADQEFRDSYTTKAPDSEDQFSEKELTSFGCYYHGHGDPWDLYLTADAPIGSTNWALWLKILLLFYDYDNSWGHVARETYTITPKENEPITLDNIKRYSGLESADFGAVGFNNAGEAVYDPWQPAVILVDEYALNTGLVLILFFHTNGTPYEGCRMRALNFFYLWTMVNGLAKPLEDLMIHYGTEQDPLDKRISVDDEPLDMREPLADILRNNFEGLEVEEEEWKMRLDELAPGYLAAETAGDGLAKDFDLFGSGFDPD